MSRTIKDSVELLDSSLDNIKTSLEAKLPSGGGIDTLKVSEVSSYIDQIETDGGGSGSVDYFHGKALTIDEGISRLVIYDVMESQSTTKSFTLHINMSEIDYNDEYDITLWAEYNNLTIESCSDENFHVEYGYMNLKKDDVKDLNFTVKGLYDGQIYLHFYICSANTLFTIPDTLLDFIMIPVCQG